MIQYVTKLNSSEKILKKALAAVQNVEDDIVMLVEEKKYQQIKHRVWDSIYDSYTMMINFVNDHYGLEEEIEEKNRVNWDDYLHESSKEFNRLVDAAFLLGNSISINQRLDIILETECTSIFNKGMYNIMKEYCDYGTVCGGLEGGTCPKCTPSFHRYDIKTLGEKLPPYHPQCRCVVKYEVRETDDDRSDDSDVS